jgi:hypothetical protein
MKGGRGMKTVPFRIVAFVIIATMLFALTPMTAKAEEGNKVLNFFKKVITYPFRVGKESTKVATDTATKGAETVYQTGKAAAGVATFDVEKTKDLVVEPVVGSASTARTAVEGSIKMPIEAAKEEDIIE